MIVYIEDTRESIDEAQLGVKTNYQMFFKKQNITDNWSTVILLYPVAGEKSVTEWLYGYIQMASHLYVSVSYI